MTTNKPKIAGYISLCDLENMECRLEPVHIASDPWPGMVALIHLSAYEALQAECEQLRKDAGRYRYLADECCAEWRGEKGPVLVHATPWTCNWRVELDAAIDAAMAKEAHP